LQKKWIPHKIINNTIYIRALRIALILSDR